MHLLLEEINIRLVRSGSLESDNTLLDECSVSLDESCTSKESGGLELENVSWDGYCVGDRSGGPECSAPNIF